MFPVNPAASLECAGAAGQVAIAKANVGQNKDQRTQARTGARIALEGLMRLPSEVQS